MASTTKPTQQKVLITGGSGFIGTHLARHLSSNGYSVRIADLKTPQVDCEYAQGDVRNISFIENQLDWADIVFHFAANVSVPYCDTHVEESYDNNFTATIRIANLLLTKNQKTKKSTRLVFASSAAVYAMNGKQNTPIREENVSQTPLSHYAAQKLNAELALRTFASKGLECVVFRFFNVFGQGQDPSSPYSGVITLFANAIRENQNIRIFGDGSYTRDFVSVTDIARACEKAIHLDSKFCDAQAMNLGTSKSTSILELANLMLSEANKSQLKVQHLEFRSGDVPHSCASIEAAKQHLNWLPQETLREKIKELL